ncbi:zeta toxin family protein [Echinicola marina]|uniref:zeta toxin family protein n=1 Tax=Echinicola marina TaxID=2859768 RepID=UPI001CF64D6D|nr:zeta toxin family protein [Echinicola marina]UCS94006.1 zeta toxin family protein [Echinicola marina]
MKKLYIVAGCNGAGKTTASYTILPEILDCKEYVNADEIAKGLSPFQPEKANIQAGKLMLRRIKDLIRTGQNFAFETTLSTRSYTNLIKEAKEVGFEVYLLFFWLRSSDLAVQRVRVRVQEGGHHIPENVIHRRYVNGLKNFFNLYLPIVDQWILINNSGEPYEIIAKNSDGELNVNDKGIWKSLKQNYDEQS